MIRAVVRSPFTEPSFLISIRSFARRLPFTLPYTTTSRALMSAVTFAVGPTVSFRSSSWISPSAEPSISRSSVPEISPFTRRLDPSHPVSRSAPASNGLITSRRIIASLGLIGSVLFLLHIESSYGQHTQFPDGVRQLDRPLRLAEIPCEFPRPALRAFPSTRKAC